MMIEVQGKYWFGNRSGFLAGHCYGTNIGIDTKRSTYIILHIEGIDTNPISKVPKIQYTKS